MQKKYFGLEANALKTEKLAVCAVTTKEDGTAVYEVARINSGVEAGFFVNPQSLYFNDDLLTSFDVQRGKPHVSLAKVNKEVFDCYLKFLKTKNLTHLRHAERECI